VSRFLQAFTQMIETGNFLERETIRKRVRPSNYYGFDDDRSVYFYVAMLGPDGDEPIHAVRFHVRSIATTERKNRRTARVCAPAALQGADPLLPRLPPHRRPLPPPTPARRRRLGIAPWRVMGFRMKERFGERKAHSQLKQAFNICVQLDQEKGLADSPHLREFEEEETRQFERV
jgi:hypothetical protein